jgi:hypothetical protein
VGYILPAIFGFIAGALSGFVVVYLFPSYFEAMLAQIIAGIVAGAFLGGLIGSISGELNASGNTSTHRLLVAATFGAIGGIIGATKLGAIWAIFRYMHWRTPFNMQFLPPGNGNSLFW